MWRNEILKLFEKQVFPIGSGKTWCNPYLDALPDIDRAHAPSIRRENLCRYMDSIETPEWIAVGEALGPRGGRFSGVPFTSEVQVCGDQMGFHGEQSSARSVPYSERTATIFWEEMHPWRDRFLAWNIYPFHPHRVGEPLSIRSPTPAEIRLFAPVLREMIACVAPRFIIAIGRKAEIGLREIGVDCQYIRHPSHGGEKSFREGIKKSPLC